MKAYKETFSKIEIDARIAEIGGKIRADAGTSEVFLIGILKGSAVFLSDLIRAISGEVGYAFVDVIRDVGDTGTAEAIEIDFLTHFEMEGKNLYLLKDVVSSGIIENYLMTQLRQQKPADLKLVALLDRPEARTVEVNVDYEMFKVDRGVFVGYGLESGGRYGNLPFIATME
ncbi:MAG TPA: phosphoribosyltransferase family protein [Thermoanaerobaculia bacterium]|nr:phosphoribosyltransferase family protein [Thermoanaerobaculia bacterium]